MEISASILSIKDDIKNNIKRVDNLEINYIHLDIMDGKFVTNKTRDFEEIVSDISEVTKPLDVHLMVADIKKYIDKYALLNPKFITFHIEAADNPSEIIEYIKSKNIKVGISIKPNTDIEDLGPYLREVDLVLVMSVEPGYGGQAFINEMEEKIDELRLLKNAYQYPYLIEVDGGINDKTIYKCINADILVIGSYITGSSNYGEKLRVIKEKLRK